MEILLVQQWNTKTDTKPLCNDHLPPQFNDQPSPRPRTGVGTDRLRQSVSHGGQYHRQTTGVNLSLDTKGGSLRFYKALVG